MAAISELRYDQVLSRLTAWAQDDWLDVDVLVHMVRECFDHRPDYAEVRPLAVRAIRDLIAAGAEVGDIGEEGFKAWPMNREEMADHLVRGLEERTTYPEADELGWIAFPDAEQDSCDR